MQNISEVLALKHEHRVIHAFKVIVHRLSRTIMSTILLSVVGLAVLVGFSSVVWVTTWHGEVQFRIGQLYENGSQLTPQNFTKAFTWYADAAEKGDAQAQLKLAEMYRQGKGVHHDLSEALVRYQILVNQGNAFAQYQLAQMYLSGQGVARNIGLGVSLLEDSANQEHAEAAYALGSMYAKGFGSDAEEQSILSDAGVMYDNMQEGVSQDYKRAAKWYLKAATLGNADAQSALGMLYFEGNGVPRNPFTAYVLEALAVVRGSVKAPIYRNLVVAKLTQDQIFSAQPLIDNWAVGQPVIFAK